MLLKGILLALVLSILVGPVFFILLQIAVDKGWKSGVYFSSGVWLSDFIYLNLAHFGIKLLGSLFESDQYRQNVGYLGGVVLIIFGLASILGKQKPIIEGRTSLNVRNKIYLSAKGFAINTLNPVLFIFWMGVMASLGITKTSQFIWFLIGFMTMIVTTDILKIYLANVIRTKLKTSYLTFIKKTSGVVILSIGVYILVKTIGHHF